MYTISIEDIQWVLVSLKMLPFWGTDYKPSPKAAEWSALGCQFWLLRPSFQWKRSLCLGTFQEGSLHFFPICSAKYSLWLYGAATHCASNFSVIVSVFSEQGAAQVTYRNGKVHLNAFVDKSHFPMRVQAKKWCCIVKTHVTSVQCHPLICAHCP